MFKDIQRGRQRRLRLFQGFPFLLFKDSFSNAAAAPLAALADADTKGVWATVDVENLMSVSGGKLQVPAQATAVWGEEYRRAQPDASTQYWTRPTGKALVAVATFNQSTRNSQIPVGWFNAATLGLNANTRGAVYTNTNVLQAAQGGSGVSDAQAQSASTDYNGIAVWTSWGVLTYIKISGIWHLKWVRPDVFTNGYCGITNLNAIGTIDDFKIVSVDENLFAPSLDINAPSVGNLPNMPDGDFLMYMDNVSVPSAGTNFLFMRKRDASNYWRHGVLSAGDFRIAEVVGGSASNRITGAGVVNTDDLITIARANVLNAWRNTTQLGSTYSSAYNFVREVGLELSTLGTGGAIGNIKVWKARLLNEAGFGSNIVVNGTFTTDTNWNKGAGWTISGGTANKAAGSATNLTASVNPLTLGKYYKVTLTISAYTAGNFNLRIGGISDLALPTANGTYTFYALADGAALTINASATGAASFDDFIVEEILFTDDTLATALNGVLAA